MQFPESPDKLEYYIDRKGKFTGPGFRTFQVIVLREEDLLLFVIGVGF